MKHRVLTRLTSMIALLPVCGSVAACGAAPDVESDPLAPDLSLEGSGTLHSEGCPSIGPGCPVPPITLPPGCAIGAAGALLSGPTSGTTRSATSPNTNYGSTTCSHRWIVEFATSSASHNFVPTPSFADITVANEVGRAGCQLSYADVQVLGFNGTWHQVQTIHFHGVVTPTLCVAQPEQMAATLQGYTKIRTAVQRAISANGVTQYLQATGSLTGF